MNVCFSGGAVGSDTEWGKWALKNKHDLKHYIFEDHKSKCPNTIIIDSAMLRKADPFLSKANETLTRRFPCKSEFANNLLRRNFYQIINSERVYAISTFKDNFINGGTAWACQMYLDLCLEEGKIPELYVYEQAKEKWTEYVNGKFNSIEKPIRPHGKWTGIGTKKISLDAISEIQSL